MSTPSMKKLIRKTKQSLSCFEVMVTQIDENDDLYTIKVNAAQADTATLTKHDRIILKCEDDFKRGFSLADKLSDLRADTPLVCPLIDPPPAPQFSRGHRLSPAELLEVQEQVKDLLAKGFISPSSSPWGSPVLFIAKPDGSWRMAIDYRKLNKVTVPNRYPLPRIDDLFDQVRGAKVFSNLDLRNAYHNVRLHDSDVPKTAFITPMGLFEFKVLPFGLANAPSAFTKVMNTVFRDFIGKFVVIYLDDILIFSKDDEEHEKHIRMVLQRLEDNHLFLKREKCRFFQPEVKYLGHVLSGDGIRVNATKAFDEIKRSLTNAPLLAHPDPLKDYRAVADASIVDPLSRNPDFSDTAAMLLQRLDPDDPLHARDLMTDILAAYKSDDWFDDPRNVQYLTHRPDGFWIGTSHPKRSASSAQIVLSRQPKTANELLQINTAVPLSTKNLKYWSNRARKLLPRFVSPFEVSRAILKRGETTAATLNLPEGWKIHPTFHVSLIKAYVDDGSPMIRANPDHFRTTEEPIYEISKIVDHKLESGLLKYYVQWLNSDHIHSWELESDLALPCTQHIEHYWRLNPGNPRPLTKVGQHTDIDRRPTRREIATVTPDEFALRKSARLQEKSQA
eukprot:gene26337-biopygen11291